jgi:hypothetical protein
MKGNNNFYVCSTTANDSLTRLSMPGFGIEFWIAWEEDADTGYAVGTGTFVFGQKSIRVCLYSDGDVRVYDTHIYDYVETLIGRLYRAWLHCDVRSRHLLDVASAMVQGEPTESEVSRDLHRGYCFDRNTRRVRKITRRERNLWGA